MGYNPPANAEGHLLFESLSRTTTHSSNFKRPPAHVRGVRIWIVSSAITDSPSVVFSIQTKHPTSASYKTVLDSAAVTDASTTLCLDVYPGSPTVTNVVAGRHIGSGFRVTATHGDSDAITYTVYYQWLP
jgi:hypothetical protein